MIDAPVISIARLADGTEGTANGTFRVSRTGGDISASIVVNYTFDSSDSTCILR